MSDPLRLLVSVRSTEEAAVACRCGVDIVDVKEPAHGPLGRADSGTHTEIASTLSAQHSPPPLSLALGELRECSAETPFEIPEPYAFAKLGLAGHAGTMDWVERWMQVRASQRTNLNWIAVGYADAFKASSPPVDEIVTAAIQTDCRGVLLDTYDKSAESLLELLDVAELKRIRQRLDEAGLWMAVAGRVQLRHLALLREVGADIVAIRSAACRNGDRHAPIDAGRLCEWVEEVHDITRSRFVL